jgi:hypothetical protein
MLPSSAGHDSVYRTVRSFALYRTDDRSLHLSANSGFFSNNTVGLRSLCDALRAGLVVDRIYYLFCFGDYRTSEQPIYEYDLYPDYFTHNPEVWLPDPGEIGFIPHHGYYSNLGYNWLNPLLHRYYSPAPRVREIVADWKSKYGFDSGRTIGVFYRGTDKGTEVKLARPRAYLDLTRTLLKRHPDYRVLIQTDQQQVREMFVDELGDRCWYIEEMPVTRGQSSVAHLSVDERGLDSYQFGLRILAATLLFSECAQIVNYTGNMGLWVALYRGHWNNAWQFGATGKLCTPFRQRLHRQRQIILQFLNDCRHPHRLIDKIQH